MIDEYTSWKASQAYPWAESVRKTVKRLKQREDALDELRGRYDGLKAVRYDSTGGGTKATGDEQMARFVEQMEQMQSQWVEALSEWRDEVSEFEKALRRIDPTYDQLLTARYMRDLPWDEVASFMCYEEGYVRGDMKSKALAALYDAMPPHLRTSIPTAY